MSNSQPEGAATPTSLDPSQESRDAPFDHSRVITTISSSAKAEKCSTSASSTLTGFGRHRTGVAHINLRPDSEAS